MKITNLKDKLNKNLPFNDVWITKDDTGYPKSELGYIRADHDGYRWHNTCWSAHRDLGTDKLIAEFDAVYDAFTRSFKDLSAMAKWCGDNAREVSYDEFNAYYVGEYGCYWLRMITRRRDYNLYLHCYSKEAM